MLGLQYLTLLCITLTAVSALPKLRIAGGDPAPEGEYPFQVSIQSDGAHYCSGTILTQRHILTAKDCIERTNLLNTVIIAGTNDLKENGAEYSIKKFYVPKNTALAILYTYQEIDFNARVRPINITTKDYREDKYLVKVAGWGALKDYGHYSDVLQEIDSKILHQMTCKHSFYSSLEENELCAWSTSEAAVLCGGDLGSPLIADGVVIGIATSTRMCGVTFPDKYLRTYYYRQQIEKVINEL